MIETSTIGQSKNIHTIRSSVNPSSMVQKPAPQWLERMTRRILSFDYCCNLTVFGRGAAMTYIFPTLLHTHFRPTFTAPA
jgi:hypothetical protein